MNKEIKYEYLLHTWGGFYNDEHKLIHSKEPGYYYFDTAEKRNAYIKELRKIEKELNAKILMIFVDEGYHLRTMVTLHRVIEFEGKKYYRSRDMYYGCSFKDAEYHITHKWYPGFNDYPLGSDFDYSKVTVIQEWITGSF